MEELISTLRIIRTPFITLKLFWSLIDKHKTASAVLNYLNNSPDYQYLQIASAKAAKLELETCQKNNITILAFFSESFPQILRSYPYCPPVLYCKGNLDLLKKNLVSIVGSRNCSGNSAKFCYALSSDLSQNDLVIVSGFARGIDSAAHLAALKNQATIAVFASGLDIIYPKENKDLYNQIIQHGLIISEHPPGTAPRAQYFPQRNRIIAGLAIIVAIIEAKINSGTMITAKYALEQGKEIFAVPGFPMDPHYQGNNYLIKNGAQILLSSADILDYLSLNQIIDIKPLFSEAQNFSKQIQQEASENQLTQAAKEIITLISSTPISLEDLILLSKYPAEIVSAIIVELELSGKISRGPGNYFTINL